MKAILFLGTSLLGSKYIAESVSQLGYRPIFLLNIDEYSGDARQALERCEYYKADVNSLKDVMRAINENQFMKDVVGITSLLDETIPNVCAVAEKFGIAGPDKRLAQLTDKAHVRNYIPEFSPPSIVFTITSLQDKDINEFLNNYKEFNEFILKPGISSGAVGASILKNNTTKKQIEDLIYNSGIEGANNQNWVIQPRLSGRLYSLEGYVKEGQVTFLGYTGRIRKELTEIVSMFPIDNEIPKHLQQRTQEAVKTLVQRSNYQYGYFHCEFLIDSESAYFIDGNMGRIAGASIVQQIALVYGKKPVDIYKHVFDLGIFQGIHTEDFYYEKVSDKQIYGINYCIPESAKVLKITERSNLTTLHTRIANNEKAVPAAGVSDSSWVGFLVGTKDEVLTDIGKLEIETDLGLTNPFYIFEEQYGRG